MKNLRIATLVLLGSVSLAGINQVLFRVPLMIALGGMAVAFFAPASVLGLPFLQRRSVLFSTTTWLAFALFLHLILVSQGYTLMTSYVVIEVLLLLLSIGLAYQIGRWLQQADEQGRLAGITQVLASIPTLEQARPDIHAEISRSRHFERPLAVIAFQISGTQTGNAAAEQVHRFNRRMLQEFQQGQLAQHLLAQKQHYQQLIRDSKAKLFYLVCPELDHNAAAEVGQQISNAFSNQGDIVVHYAVAAFPEDGFTFNKIRKEAAEKVSTRETSTNGDSSSTAANGVGDQIEAANLVADE